MQDEWFSRWFDSPYYHVLYQHHNDDEARVFIDNLFACLLPSPEARMLDLACGKGRHALYMSRFGYDVTGLDISSSSIAFARQFEHDKLAFYQHDMRKPFRVNYFDFIFNFFTSFGYFQTEQEHLQTLRNVQRGLRPGGIFVLDFMNARKVVQNLVEGETRVLNDITFSIHREVRNNLIVKTITLNDQGQEWTFEERVNGFDLPVLQAMFASSGLEIIAQYGNYELEEFEPDRSDRLILFGQKSKSSLT
ncbi:MAG: class I SAM-dependent methyltransferase [Saprospiraceae bacterium]|nr:class I SAM-dependent methyltransferase [Saprospiraceae bacterium]